MNLPHAIQRFASGTWPENEALGCVTLSFDDRHRRRMRMKLDHDGGEFILDMQRAVRLCDGDGLLLNNGRWVLVRAAPEAVIDVTAPLAKDTLRIAWHLGNRHLAVQILDDGSLRIRYDHVIEHMIIDLGGQTQRRVEIFSPEAGAYENAPAHSHSHEQSHEHSHDT